MANHELLNQLAITSWILDKLRSIQKQCQYSIDKLLDHAKRARPAAASADGSNAAALKFTHDFKAAKPVAINDELSHKPNLDALRPPDGVEDEENPMNLYHKPERNEDGIYRPLKLNPKLMDTPNNILTKREERKVAQFRKRVKNSDIYQSVKESMTNLPAEERFFLENTERFASDKHAENRSKSRMQDMRNVEEDRMMRLTGSIRESKAESKRRRYQETRVGEDLDKFVDNLSNTFRDAKKLGDYQAGGRYHETIGKGQKKELKGGRYIAGHWRRRERILFNKTKKGRKVQSRKRWRKEHPLKRNPARGARMQLNKYKKRTVIRRLLKKLK